MKVTISGSPGSGKSTVGNLVAKKLGYSFYSSGDFFRQLAKEKHMDVNEFSEYCEKHPEMDDIIDRKQAEFGKLHDNFVLDSRLGFYFIPDSVKIFLDAGIETRAKRIFRDSRNDEKSKNETEALFKLQERENSEINRWIKYYNISYQNKTHFDLVIQTDAMSAEEAADKIVDFIERRK